MVENMSLMIEDDSVLVQYKDISNKIKEIKLIKFHSNPVYDEKYIKAKIKEFNLMMKYQKRVSLHLYSLYKYWTCYENGEKELYISLFRRVQV